MTSTTISSTAAPLSWYHRDDSRSASPSVGDVVWQKGQRVVITRVTPRGLHRWAGGRDGDYSHWDSYDCEGRPVTAQDVLRYEQASYGSWSHRTAEETGFGVDERGLGTFTGRVIARVSVQIEGKGTNRYGEKGHFGKTVWVEIPNCNSLEAAREAIAVLDPATLPWRGTDDFGWLEKLTSIRVGHGYVSCYHGPDEHPFYREYIPGQRS